VLWEVLGEKKKEKGATGNYAHGGEEVKKEGRRAVE
jgi:hypothetical protein